MRRISLLTAALVVPVLAAAPADAVGENVICVNIADASCNQPAASIPAAITIANGNGVADVIFVGPGTYSDGPYQLTSGQGLTLKGSGPGTVITLPANPVSQLYVTANGVTVRDLTVDLAATDSANDEGIRAYNGAVVDNVTVDGTGTADATGMHTILAQVTRATVVMPSGSGSRGVYGEGGATFTDSTISGSTAFNHSGQGSTDTLTRTTLHAGTSAGVATDSGSVDIDNSVVNLGGTGGTGLLAANFNNSTSPKAINADHVTVIGGNGNSEGAWAWASAPGAKQTSTVTLTNSIVRVPGTSLIADADNNGAQGGSSTAVVHVTYSDYQTTGGTIGANGSGGIDEGNGNLDVDPAFVGAGDFHLSKNSPVIDKGNPAAGLPGDMDRDRAARVVDGDGNGTAVRDMGAYELPDLIAPVDTIAPETTITRKPAKRITKKRARFAFSSEPGARFECRLDRGAWKPCTSPKTVRVKKGKHVFAVRASDLAGNVDPTPATYRFRRV